MARREREPKSLMCIDRDIEGPGLRSEPTKTKWQSATVEISSRGQIHTKPQGPQG